MAHLTLNRIHRFYAIPPQVHWFFDGWGGYRFSVDESGGICLANPPKPEDWRDVTMHNQALALVQIIQITVDDTGGLSAFIDWCIDTKCIVWVDDIDIDEQPDDYIDPTYCAQCGAVLKFGCDHDA